MKIRSYRITIVKGKSARYDCKSKPPPPNQFGFYYWKWRPTFKRTVFPSYNVGGRYYREGGIDIRISWLCFWVAVTIFGPIRTL